MEMPKSIETRCSMQTKAEATITTCITIYRCIGDKVGSLWILKEFIGKLWKNWVYEFALFDNGRLVDLTSKVARDTKAWAIKDVGSPLHTYRTTSCRVIVGHFKAKMEIFLEVYFANCNLKMRLPSSDWKDSNLVSNTSMIWSVSSISRTHAYIEAQRCAFLHTTPKGTLNIQLTYSLSIYDTKFISLITWDGGRVGQWLSDQLTRIALLLPGHSSSQWLPHFEVIASSHHVVCKLAQSSIWFPCYMLHCQE